MSLAQEWINTDPYGVMSDIERLGERAAEYQMELIEDSLSVGDNRWVGITLEEMKIALKSFSENLT